MYLKIDRVDLALTQVKQMKSIDEDNPLTLLATAWTHLSVVGGHMLQLRSDLLCAIFIIYFKVDILHISAYYDSV